ncbi:hypothetical protein [Crenobacter cavernae]|uniref:hypothetical protein n=1 Tax=Crenobacter cavernae TaxID=2290923 RepID=UPI00141A13F1|nr:hypothetical protein [Crenobacter cavernae]
MATFDGENDGRYCRVSSRFFAREDSANVTADAPAAPLRHATVQNFSAKSMKAKLFP